MADYVRGVFGPARWPTYYDAWSRRLARLAFRITPAMLEDKTSRTLNEVPQVVESPKFWTPVSFPLAARRGRGMPAAEWLFTPSQVINVANHGDDVVYFNIPLLGDLSVEADTTVSNWRETAMMVGARWVAPSYTLDSYDLGTPRRILMHVESGRPSTRLGSHWYRHRTIVQDRTAVVSLDGRTMHREKFSGVRDPWIGVRSPQLNEGGAKNVRISGSPVIPERIDLIGAGLDSWIDYTSRG